MSGRRREGLTPTLFPFLAVLVCTLGTLILLLAMVAQNAGEAIAASQSNATPADPAAVQRLADVEQAEAVAQAAAQIDRQLREAQWYREHTVKMRDEQTSELEQRRNQLAHLEDHLRRLREELAQLTTEVEHSLENKGDAQAAQTTLDQLLIAIEAEKQAIGNLQGELQSKKPRIVIVPHKGPNGTDRRPIYIQCDRDGVYLQPGGQRIELAQLDPTSGRANPLDAALRTIRHHAMQTYGDSVAPYPLLVVSPEGIETYAVARAAMSHWDDQFGYELVPAGMELAFPAADPVLDDKVAAAIRQAVAQREAVALRSGAGGGSGSYAGGSHSQGQERFADHAGSSPGQVAGAGGDATTGSHSASASRSGSPAFGNSGEGGTASPPASSLPVLSAAQMSRGGLPGATGYPGSTGGGNPAERSGPITGSGYASGVQNTRGSANTGHADSGGTATLAQREAAAEASRRIQQQDQLNGQWDAATQPPLASALLSDPRTSSQPSGIGSGMNPADNASLDSGASGPLALNPPQSASGPGAASGSTSGQASGQTGGAGPMGPSTAAGGTGGTQASGADAMAASQGQTRDASASPSLNFSPSTTPPVTRVGKDWGLPSDLTSRRGTEMLRMIRIECHADRFVLLPEGGRGSATTFHFDDGDVNRASLELATAVRDRAAGWGAAMQGARWQPVLDVAVVSGGEARYQQLLRLMDGSGVTIQARGTR